MSKRILIEQDEIALMEDSRLLYYEKAASGIQAEQIYLAVVDRMVRGIQAAFVRLGDGQTGFLPFSECARPPRSGDALLLQVKKPPVGEKAPYMTADLSLAGRYVILTPESASCGVSQKITGEEERHALLSLARQIAPEGMGVILRTEALGQEETILREETATLRQTWREIQAAAAAAAAPCLIRGRQDPLSRLIRDEHGTIDEILSDRPGGLFVPGIPVRSAEHPFGLFNVREKWEKALKRKIWLDCGGFLVVDRTEALTVIDVNSGKYTGEKTGTEHTFLKLNLEAARESARILRLRGLGGIILIDFVDMQSEESRARVLAALEESLRDDPVKTVIHGFTHLGLLEMTRKKAQAPQESKEQI